MSFSSFTHLGTTVFTDVDLDATVAQLSASGKDLFGIEVDNSQNTTDVHVKLYADATASIGDAPYLSFRVDAGAVFTLSTGSQAEGLAFANGLAVACVTTPGTAGTTSPTNAVKATLITN